MSSDRTFYINHASLVAKRKKIQDDYWGKDVSGDKVWERLYQICDEDKPEIQFKNFGITVEWFEFTKECNQFRDLLTKYKIEFQEAI